MVSSQTLQNRKHYKSDEDGQTDCDDGKKYFAHAVPTYPVGVRSVPPSQLSVEPADRACLKRVRHKNTLFGMVASEALKRAVFEPFGTGLYTFREHAGVALWAARALDRQQFRVGSAHDGHADDRMSKKLVHVNGFVCPASDTLGSFGSSDGRNLAKGSNVGYGPYQIVSEEQLDGHFRGWRLS